MKIWRLFSTKPFEKSIRSLPNKVAIKIWRYLEQFEAGVTNPYKLPGIKKIKGFKDCFRLRFGDYRVGVFLDRENNIIRLQYAGKRGDFYKRFPSRT